MAVASASCAPAFCWLYTEQPTLTQSRGPARGEDSCGLSCRRERGPREVVQVIQGHLAEGQHQASNANHPTLEDSSSSCFPGLHALTLIHKCKSTRACPRTHTWCLGNLLKELLHQCNLQLPAPRGRSVNICGINGCDAGGPGRGHSARERTRARVCVYACSCACGVGGPGSPHTHTQPSRAGMVLKAPF